MNISENRSKMVKICLRTCETSPEALVQIPLAGSADAKISQLAERVSVLVAALQKRCDEDKEASGPWILP